MVFTHTALDAPVTERMPRTLDEENEDTSVRKDSESSHSTTTDAIISDEEQSDAEPRERWTKFVTLSPEQFGRFKMRASSRPIYGGFSDVWRCDAKFADGKLIQVAVKKFRTIRIAHDADESTIAHKLLKRLTKELRIWMALKHPNISPLLGFVLSGDMCMISPWHSHGDVEAYIRRHPTTDRMKLVYEVACGLAYLHNQTYPVVHGDMKPNNVLVDARGVAVIIDFGLSSVIESDPTLSASFTTESLQEAGCARWMAPELLMVEKCKRSPPTDVYSFGSVALYLPFKDILNLQIIYALIKGQTPAATRDGYPALQNGRADWFNNLLDSCWSTQSELRPTMANLEKIIDSKRQNWGV
ncbi:hypothetical protein FRB90_009469 [Tulasnella sp. 427]|nr:hypothetical protein FRB90_009469 [Tulasnella sp. 427]